MIQRFLPLILALFVTLATAAYQRRTGPTHPKAIQVSLPETRVKGNLVRSGTTGENARVEVELESEGNSPNLYLQYRKYKFEDNWTTTPFVLDNKTAFANLPTLPPAGKYEYRIATPSADNTLLPIMEPVVIRFKGAVPITWLVPHIIAMFSSMLVSNWIAMRLLFRQPVSIKWPITVLSLLSVGGLFFGSFVQKFAFGEYWTGFPFGTDLTDNKTLIALAGWVVAIAAFKKLQRTALWFAIILMTSVYLIPHSLGGSERDFRTDKIGSAKIAPPSFPTNKKESP